MMGKRVLVCGGRDYNDKPALWTALDKLQATRGVSVVIHGAARGADTLAGEWAASRRVPVEVYPADWNAHGKAAGHIRNAKMLTEGHPDGVVAMPGGRGTEDMIRQAKALGVPVWIPIK